MDEGQALNGNSIVLIFVLYTSCIFVCVPFPECFLSFCIKEQNHPTLVCLRLFLSFPMLVKLSGHLQCCFFFFFFFSFFFLLLLFELLFYRARGIFDKSKSRSHFNCPRLVFATLCPNPCCVCNAMSKSLLCVQRYVQILAVCATLYLILAVCAALCLILAVCAALCPNPCCVCNVMSKSLLCV